MGGPFGRILNIIEEENGGVMKLIFTYEGG